MSVDLTAAARVLARQQSLITSTQAEDARIGRKACQRLVDRGIWERLGGRGATAAPRCATDLARAIDLTLRASVVAG